MRYSSGAGFATISTDKLRDITYSLRRLRHFPKLCWPVNFSLDGIPIVLSIKTSNVADTVNICILADRITLIYGDILRIMIFVSVCKTVLYFNKMH